MSKLNTLLDSVDLELIGHELAELLTTADQKDHILTAVYVGRAGVTMRWLYRANDGSSVDYRYDDNYTSKRYATLQGAIRAEIKRLKEYEPV